MARMVKNPPAVQETRVQSLGWENLLEKAKATHSSILAWRIPWTEEPLQYKSMVGASLGMQCYYQMAPHDTFGGKTTHLIFFVSIHILSSINKTETNCVLGSYRNNLRLWIKPNHSVLKSDHLEEMLFAAANS